MIDVKCLICGTDTRVPLGTRPVAHTCGLHSGQVTESVARLQNFLALSELMDTLERNAARATAWALSEAIRVFRVTADQDEAQIKRLNPSFDRDQVNELKGRVSARRASARHLERIVHDLDALILDD